MKAFVDTNGCTLGQLETKRVQDFLERNDPTVVLTQDPGEADVLVFFACGLTDVSEQASLKFIDRLQSQRKPSSRIIVWGCLPKINPEALSPMYEGPLVGPRDVDYFNELVDERDCDCQEVWPNTLAPSFADDRYCGLKPRSFLNDKILWQLQRFFCHLEPDHHSDKELFYLRVAEGCTGHCTYCSEKLAWGRIKSRPVKEVIEEFKRGVRQGYSRFFLCAEDLGSYGHDSDYTCIHLLTELLDADDSGGSQFIIDQFNPAFLNRYLESLFDVFSSGRIELFNCQVQSGSNRILKLMGRQYTSEEWRQGMLTINKKFPGLRLGTHLMVGFPSETEQDFEQTLGLLDYPLFLRAMSVYMFSGKAKSVASRMEGQVPAVVKERRYIRLWRKYLYMYSLQSTVGRLFR